MKKFIGTKTIAAEPMSDREDRPGYKVEYPNGRMTHTNERVLSELRNARKDGVCHVNTSNAKGWDREFHDAMLLLQANPPDDIQVRCKIINELQEWTLIDLKPDTRHEFKEESPCTRTDKHFKEAFDSYGDKPQEKFIGTRQDRMKTLVAYQHFLYYFDQAHYEKKQPNGGLTRHLLNKLAYYRDIHEPVTKHNSITVLVTWVQNMTSNNQEDLLNYILIYHSDKW